MIRLAGGAAKKQYISPDFTWPDNTGTSSDTFVFNHNLGTLEHRVDIFTTGSDGNGKHIRHQDLSQDSSWFGYIQRSGVNSDNFSLYRNIFGTPKSYYAIFTEI